MATPFNQGAPTIPVVLNTSNCFVFGNTASGNALSVQQLGTGNVATFRTTTGATALFVNAAGNVGIGTSVPTSNLQVGTGGTVNFSNALYTQMNTVTGASAATITAGFNTGTGPTPNTPTAGEYQWTIGVATTFGNIVSLGLYPPGATFTWTFTARSTSTPVNFNFQTVANSVYAFNSPTLTSSYQTFTWTATIPSNGDRTCYFGVNGTASGQNIIWNSFTATRLDTILTGNIGIGTTSPQTALDVNGSMNALNYAQSTFTNQGLVTITQTSASGTSMLTGATGTTWTAYAYSNQGFKYGAFCSARTDQTTTSHMIGLATSQVNGNMASTFQGINYAWYFDTFAGTLKIYEGGGFVASYGAYTTSTVVSITFDGTNIIYWKDGVSQRTVARAVGVPLYFGYAGLTPGASVNSVQFDAFGSTTYAGRNIVGTTAYMSGTVYVGTTNTDPTFGRVNGINLRSDGRFFSRSSGHSLGIDSTSGTQIQFWTDNGSNRVATGAITSSGATTSYTSASDYRLKDNFAPITGALNIISSLNPVTYTWKSDGSPGHGFIAHELQEVVPDAVVGEKDAVDSDGNIKPQGIDKSYLISYLTAAIQELSAKNAALEARLTALEGTVGSLVSPAPPS